MPNTGRRTRLAQKTKPSRLISEISLADNLQRHRASEIDVQGFVSDPHRTATQFDRFPVFVRHQLVVLKSFRWLAMCRLYCFLERGLAGLKAASKTLAEHAYRAEFHRSRKLITAARAGALGLCAHVLTPLQAQPQPKPTPRSTDWCEIGQRSAWHTVVPLNEQFRVRLH